MEEDPENEGDDLFVMIFIFHLENFLKTQAANLVSY